MKQVAAIELVEARGAMLEREPVYKVMLFGKQVGELYYNMRGYRGDLPTPEGLSLDIGEKGISAFRAEVRKLNREFAGASR